MVDAHDDQTGADDLAPRHILEALTVRELPPDLADRVLDTLDLSAPRRVVDAPTRLPWVIAACSTVVALAATLVLVFAPKPEAPPAITPVAAPLVAAPPLAAPPVEKILAGTPVAAEVESFGHLVLAVEPRDAVVSIDGVQLPGPSPFVATNLAVGHHAIAIELAGYTSWTRELEVPTGQLGLSITLIESSQPRRSSPSVELEAEPKPDPTPDPKPDESTKPAILRIGTKAGFGPAQVYLDGKLIGQTPIVSARVAAGRHKVRWKWSDGHEVTTAISVVAGEVKLLKGG